MNWFKDFSIGLMIETCWLTWAGKNSSGQRQTRATEAPVILSNTSPPSKITLESFAA